MRGMGRFQMPVRPSCAVRIQIAAKNNCAIPDSPFLILNCFTTFSGKTKSKLRVSPMPDFIPLFAVFS